MQFALPTLRQTSLMRRFVNGALVILKRERDEAGEQIRALRLRIRDLEAAISVLEGHPAPAKLGRASGNIKQGILELLSEGDERGTTPKELTEALAKVGHTTSEASVSSTLSRLKAEDKVINRGGRWFAANAQPTQVGGQQRAQATTSEWDDLDDDVPF